jgi:hypothetical protein
VKHQSHRCRLERRAAALLLMLTLVGWTGGATYAHVDTLGAPDPQWQRFPDAPAEAATQPIDDGAGLPGNGLRVLDTFVYGLATLSVLLALSLVRAFWSARRRSGAPESPGAERRST